MEITLYIIGALLMGFLLGIALLKRKINALKKSIHTNETNLALLEQTERQLQLQNNDYAQDLKKKEELILDLSTAKAKLESTIESFKEKLESHQAAFEDNKKQMELQFERLAGKILEEKSQKFMEHNRNHLDIILNPLKEKLQHFEQKVESTYQTESKERHSLQNEIKALVEMNTKLNDEASRLTKALTGESKKQGNWGEVMLRKVLENSGLREGHEFETQYHSEGQDAQRLFPDVVVHLPEQKHLVIDSKVSLVAYERLVNAQSEEERKSAINEHIISVKNHIRQLSEKEYFKAKGIQSPDFVLMFMPIESSFGAAIAADNDLFNFAWNRKIVIVSPSTLLATLKTVASLWRQENQHKNAAKIAQEAGNLYDKFHGFVQDLQKLGAQLETVKKTYDTTYNKLTQGRGNLVSRAHHIKQLGAKTAKLLDPDIIADGLSGDDQDN